MGRDGEDGKLYILQARPETVKSQAAGQVEQHYKLKAHSAVLAEGALSARRSVRAPCASWRPLPRWSACSPAMSW